MKPDLALPEILSYVGHHSELPGLQTAYQVRYALRGEMPHFEVAVTLSDGHVTRQTIHPLRCLTLEQAKSLVCYLYENAVEPECVTDVLADLQHAAFER